MAVTLNEIQHQIAQLRDENAINFGSNTGAEH